MARKVLIGVLVAAAVLVLLGAGAAGGLYLYLQQRNRAWLATAEEAYAAQDWPKAIEFFSYCIRQEPDNEDMLLKYANANLRVMESRAAHLSNAATAYVQLLSYHPENSEARDKLIDIYEMASSWEALEYRTAEWLGLDPGNERLLYYHALSLDRLGRRDEAIQEYQKIVENETPFIDVYGNLARLLRDRGRDVQAQEIVDLALAAHPDDGRAHLVRARFFARSLDPKQMEEELEQALALSPDSPEVLAAAAQYATTRREPQRAIEYLERAIDADPTRIDTYVALAQTHRNEGSFDQAIEVLRRIPQESLVDSQEALVTLADLELSAERFDGASETIRFYKAAYPDQQPIFDYFSAREAAERGNPEQAIEILNPVVKRRPRFLPARLALAEAYIESGQSTLAKSTLESYLKERPTDGRAQMLWARHFGRAPSLQEVVRRAEELLADEKAGTLGLVSAGAALIDASARARVLDRHMPMVESLLERAIAADPEQADAYRYLTDAYVSQDSVGKAEAVMDRALASGVAPSELRMVRASVAIAKGDVASAQQACAESLAEEAGDVNRRITWANFFASRGYGAESLAILEDEAQIEKDDHGLLAIERALMQARLGDAAGAAEGLLTLAKETQGQSAAGLRLGEAAGQVALLLMNSREAAQQDAIQRLLAVGEQLAGDSPEVQSARALMLLRTDSPDLDTARELLDSVLRVQPDNVSALLAMARINAERAELQAAVEYAQRADTLAPRVPAIQLQLADLLTRLGRFAEADRVLQRVLADTPEQIGALELLVNNCLASGRVNDARSAFQRLQVAAEADPARKPALDRLQAQMSIGLGDFGQAENQLREIVAQNPEDASATRSLAAVLHNSGRTQEARALLDRFVQKRKDDPAAWVSIAEFYTNVGGPGALDSASTALTRALLVDPGYMPALRKMIDVYVQRGETAAAMGLCDRYLETNPEDPEILYEKASLLIQTAARAQEALDTVEKALAFKETPRFLAVRGLARLNLGDVRGALGDLQRASKELPATSALVDAALAEAYIKSDAPDLAQGYYETAKEKARQGEPVDIARMRRIEEVLGKEREKP